MSTPTSPFWGWPRAGLLAMREASSRPGLRRGGLRFQARRVGSRGGALTEAGRDFQPAATAPGLFRLLGFGAAHEGDHGAVSA